MANIVVRGSYIPTEYYVLEDKKLVYVSIPKVACTSIKSAMFEPETDAVNMNEYMTVHSRAEEFRTVKLTRQQKNYFVFAFVRNPFDRLVSCYEDKVKRRVQHNGRYFFDTAYNRQLLHRLYGVRFSPGMSFAEFLRTVAVIPDALADGHFKSQYSCLYRFRRRVPNYIGKFETIADDWRSLAERYGFRKLDQRNISNRIDLLDYYETLELVELAAERYTNDIRCFGYESEFQQLKAHATGNTDGVDGKFSSG